MSYNIEVNDGNYVVLTIVSNIIVLNPTITGLSSGTNYAFRVQATNVFGTSAWSDYSLIYRTDNVPSPPGIPLSPLQYPTSVTLQWALPEFDNGGYVSSYNLYISNSTINFSIYPFTYQSCSDPFHYVCAIVSGLQKGTVYYFSVSALNYVGESSLSPISAAVVTNNAPSSPGIPFAFFVNSTTINLQWTLSTKSIRYE